MYKITLNIEGMMCGMCESHINDMVRNALPIKKVSSSHSKGTTEILSLTPIDDEKLKEVIDKAGYTVKSIHTEPYEKKRFSLFSK